MEFLLSYFKRGLFIACTVLVCGCATASVDDFWGVRYDGSVDKVAVLHLLVKSGEKVIDEQYGVKKDGSLTKYYLEGYAGRLPRPDYIYVQWEDFDTLATHEQRMDLHSSLPSSLQDVRLTLVFDSGKVYLFAVHLATTTAGHPLRIVPALQIFPDPAVTPYPGTRHPQSMFDPAGQ